MSLDCRARRRHVLLLELVCGIVDERHTQLVGELDEADFACFEIDRRDGRDGFDGQIVFGECVFEQRTQDVDAGAAVAAHADDKACRMQHDSGQLRSRHARLIRDDDARDGIGRVGGDVRRHRRQRPRIRPLHQDRFTIDERPGDACDVAGVGPPERVERGDVERVGGSGEHRGGADTVGDTTDEFVGTAGVAAHERHRETTRFVHDDDPRVGLLVTKQRRDDSRRRAEREVADDERRLSPGLREEFRRRAVEAQGIDAKCFVNLVRATTSRGGVDDLSDHLGPGLRLFTINECRVIGVAVEDQDDVGFADVFTCASLVLGEDADALIIFGQTLGEDIGASQTCERVRKYLH